MKLYGSLFLMMLGSFAAEREQTAQDVLRKLATGLVCYTKIASKPDIPLQPTISTLTWPSHSAVAAMYFPDPLSPIERETKTVLERRLRCGLIDDVVRSGKFSDDDITQELKNEVMQYGFCLPRGSEEKQSRARFYDDLSRGYSIVPNITREQDIGLCTKIVASKEDNQKSATLVIYDIKSNSIVRRYDIQEKGELVVGFLPGEIGFMVNDDKLFFFETTPHIEIIAPILVSKRFRDVVKASTADLSILVDDSDTYYQLTKLEQAGPAE